MCSDLETDVSVEFIPIPVSFKCPLTHDILEDPVATADGQVYERACISEWFRQGNKTSPLTNMTLPSLQLVPNEALKRAIDEYVRLRRDLRRKPVEQRGYEFAVALWAEELAKKHSMMKTHEDAQLLMAELQAREADVALLKIQLAQSRSETDDVTCLSKEQLRARDAEISLLKHQLARSSEKRGNHNLASCLMEGEAKIALLKDQLANEKGNSMASCLLEGDAKIALLKEKLANEQLANAKHQAGELAKEKHKAKSIGPTQSVARRLLPARGMEPITVGSCATAGRCNIPSPLPREVVTPSNIQKGRVVMEKWQSTGLNDPDSQGDASGSDRGSDTSKGSDNLGENVSRIAARAMAKGRVSSMTAEERAKACNMAAKASRERQMQPAW